MAVDTNKEQAMSWKEATGRVAHNLMKSFKQEMGEGARRFFSGEVDDVYSPNDWFSFILSEKCNVADLARFRAHGITKGDEEIQLQALLAILTTQVIKGDYAHTLKCQGLVMLTHIHVVVLL